MTNSELAQLFLLQFAVLLVGCRVVGLAARRLGQPQVVAEMITGIMLGPSLFGLLFPDLHSALFPRESMAALFVVSQLGIVLFMFLVGTEFELSALTTHLRSAISISLAGIVVPFALAAALAVWLIGRGGYFADGLTTGRAVLYLGAAMAITAFPVLARIIQERGIAGTRLGAITLGAGAFDDVAAWTLLATVLASLRGEPSLVATAFIGGVVYVLTVFFVLRPLFERLGTRVERTGTLDPGSLTVVLLAVALCAWFTERIGIHAVFGAFVFGTAMPRGAFARETHRAIQPVSTHIILPLFFVYSGLNTKIGLLTSPTAWMLTAVIVLIASLGKLGGCSMAAWLTGYARGEALAIGALMNARGLMELIILNIGLERGLITPTLFTMMVVMAIVTTVAAGPLFQLTYRPPAAALPPAVKAAG
jgi:K+:H+ antiporter